MQSKSPRRGRPKGSGINDKKTLLKIAQIIAKDPSTKPTTAIKLAGIKDASSIRRLRDKYNEQAQTLLSEAGGTVKAQPAKSTKRRAAAKQRVEVAAVKSRTPSSGAKTKRSKKAAARRKTSAARTASSRKPVMTKPAVKAQAKSNGSAASTTKAIPSFASVSFMPITGTPAAQLAIDMQKTMNTMVKSQMQLYESFVAMSPVTTMLKQQAAAASMVMTAIKSAPTWPGTSHK